MTIRNTHTLQGPINRITLHSDGFASGQAAQRSPLFEFSMSQGPRVLVLYNSTDKSPSSEANRSSGGQNKSAHFMEPEDSLPHSQASATCPYPQPEQSSPCLPIQRLENCHIHFHCFCCTNMLQLIFSLHSPHLKEMFSFGS
jgi:hypothetical protein